MIRPDEQIRAGHIPAAYLPHGADPRQVVINVHTAPDRSLHAGAIGVVLSLTVGVGAVVWISTVMVLQMVTVAAETATALQAAIPTLVGGGITLSVSLSKGGK
ncbi:hypothetical protein ACFVQ0_37020 [Streptomyces sp. NPDC057900]|uniref:hypothetical protein n=1 Tax=Streptomyces sp. NPDC057900 TaxID=3346274 RepID=UPI0036EF1974